jgi:hypothetical protein
VLTVSDEVVSELANFLKFLQQSNLTTIEVHIYVRAVISKLCPNYLDEIVCLNDEVAQMIASDPEIDKSPAVKYVG